LATPEDEEELDEIKKRSWVTKMQTVGIVVPPTDAK
jgi:hypothetical protein